MKKIVSRKISDRNTDSMQLEKKDNSHHGLVTMVHGKCHLRVKVILTCFRWDAMFRYLCFARSKRDIKLGTA